MQEKNTNNSPCESDVSTDRPGLAASFIVILFLPAAVFLVSLPICEGLDRSGMDERSLSLVLGFPAMITAIGLAIYFGLNGQKIVAVVGVIVWVLVCAFNILVTFAFWNG